MENAPQDRIFPLLRWVGGLPSRRCTAKEVRQIVLDWAEGKETRMTPWGIQVYHTDRKLWVPPMRYQDFAVICGHWIRDVEVPENFAGHPAECTCYGRLPLKMTFTDSPSYSQGILQAFQHGEVTDPELELAESLPRTTLPASDTSSCLLMELPPELLELILDHLVPTGQTYHFFPARSGKDSVQIVQKFVPDTHRNGYALSARAYETAQSCASQAPAPHSKKAIEAASPKYPATGSAYTSLAGTCRQFQDIIYGRLFSQNAFIFHLTPHTIHSEVRSSDFTKFRCWTRTTPHPPGALGPLTAQAAKYLKNVTLIGSLPFSHGSQDIKALNSLFDDAASMLSEAKLSSLSIVLNLARPGSNDNRFSLPAIPVAVLQAEVDKDDILSVRVRDPQIQSVRESNKTQRVLAPLLQGPKGVKEVVLNGPLSGGFVKELEDALKST